MDRAEFRERLDALAPDDEAGLVTAIRERVSSLSGRHLDIQERIQESDRARRDLEDRLAEIERRIVAQADASVEQDVDSIDDVESLPADADVEFDPELMREVEEIRTEARANQQRTSEQGADLQAELSENTEELELYGDLLAQLEADELTAAEARERLLDRLDDKP